MAESGWEEPRAAGATGEDPPEFRPHGVGSSRTAQAEPSTSHTTDVAARGAAMLTALRFITTNPLELPSRGPGGGWFDEFVLGTRWGNLRRGDAKVQAAICDAWPKL
ncbi:MAG: hypothetical protein JO166_06135 [Deltaproteobacteria bacterium]|nr:hypothetical protein [Deltaproteobacteria bacterium]